MSSPRVDFAWRLFSKLVVDVLIPLPLISLALFMSVGYILTLLLPVDINVWTALFWLSLPLPLGALLERMRRCWLKSEAVCFSWRVCLPVLPLLILLPTVAILVLYPSLDSIAHTDILFTLVIQLL